MSDEYAKQYKPIPLPQRGSRVIKAGSKLSGGDTARTAFPQKNEFTEIPIAPAPKISAAPNKPRELSAEKDKKIGIPPRDSDHVHEMIYKMRALQGGTPQKRGYMNPREYMRGLQDSAVVFYKQAVFMKDFTDDSDAVIPFHMYYPTYQQMSYGQLRTYFSWRTKVREGRLEAIPLSYAYLYIYELINNIGVASPLDGLITLVRFWKKFRKVNVSVDKHLYSWIRDYHVCYNLPVSFNTFSGIAKLPDSASIQPVVEGFMLYSAISKYNVRRSAFFTGENAGLLERIFMSVISGLREVLRDAGANPDAFIYGPGKEFVRPKNWTPFAGAVFFSDTKQEPRYVALSDKEVYFYNNGSWKLGAVPDSGRSFVGYVMKLTEILLRERVKFNRKLSVRLDTLNPMQLEKLKSCGIDIEQTVRDLFKRFFAEETRQEIVVDKKAIEQIRRAAYEIQEKLIVEETEEADIMPLEIHEEQISVPKPVIQLVETLEVDEKRASEGVAKPSDEWSRLYDSFNGTEREAIRKIISGGSLNCFAEENGVMLEVLVDGINEKAYDNIGDTLLEIGGDVTIYEEYHEKIAEMVMI